MKINFKTVKQFIALSILMKSIVACSSDDLSTGENPSSKITKGDVGEQGVTEIYTDSTKNGAILLSTEPLGNPYNVDTLKKAYALLYPNGNGQAGMPGFHPTHYQVRFLPADSVEFAALMASDLVLTTIPLDKKVTGEGTYYFDPVLEAQNAPYTWQYTIVPATEQLPNMRHEITAEICAPNDGSKGRSVDGLSNIWPALEAKAYEMCGEKMPSTVASRGAGGVGAPGDHLKRVFVWDDKANQYIPAKGAKVVFWKPIGGSSCIVDENGNYLYPGGSYRRVEIQWADKDRKWIINDGEGSFNKQAIYSCNTANGAWTFRIKGGKQQTFAVATRALHRFYNEYNHGLPIPNSRLLHLKVICIDGHSDEYAGLYSPGNTIRIWGKTSNSGDNNKLTQSIYGSTAHELGHFIHYKCIISNTKNWNKTDDILIESWARFVQWITTEYEYNYLSDIIGRSGQLSFVERESLPSWGVSGPPGQPGPKFYNKPTEYNFQNWPFFNYFLQPTEVDTNLLAYSPLFVDLFDRDNQTDYYRARSIKDNWPNTVYKKYPNDMVSDYLTVQVIYALRSATNLTQLRENIKNARYNSEADKVKIDTLFNRYIYYWNKYK